jgi:hypothetical protein
MSLNPHFLEQGRLSSSAIERAATPSGRFFEFADAGFELGDFTVPVD